MLTDQFRVRIFSTLLRHSLRYKCQFSASSVDPGTSGIIRSEFPKIPLQDQPVHDMILESISRHASEQSYRPALLNAENPLDNVTYSELQFKIQHAADFLSSIGFSKGGVATVLLPNCWQYFVIYTSVLMRGGCISGLNPLSSDFELHRFFVETNCKLAFIPDSLLDRVWEVTQKCPFQINLIVVPTGFHPQNSPSCSSTRIIQFSQFINFISKNGHESAVSKISVQNDLAFLPFSSGTTGPPKPVMLSHQNIGTMARIFNKHLDEQVVKKMNPKWDWKNEHFLLVLPLFHIYGFILGLNILLSGASGILFKQFNVDLFCKTVQDLKIKFVMLVPPIMVALAKSRAMNRYDLSSLRFIMTGAAPVGEDICDELMRAIPSVEQISQGYGMTEESMASHLPVFGMKNSRAAGRLAANFEMKIIDVEKRTPVPIGETGEICCRGPTIMLGYLNRPKESADSIDEDGWLKTGDIGYHDEQGWTYVVDRLKELIKVKGLQVAPAELEGILLAHEGILDCAVVGIGDKWSGELPKAFVVRRANSQLTETEVKEFVRARVASYKQLAAVEFVDEIPKSPSGKILRRLFREW